MAKLLGQTVPDSEFPWVRGSLFGQNGRAILLWALCGQAANPAELTSLDRHENAHTLITALAGPDHDPPSVFREGWAESQSSDRDSQICRLAQRRKDGSNKPWSIAYTTRSEDEGVTVEHEVEVDPALGWKVIRHVDQIPGKYRTESETQYQRLDGIALPTRRISRHSRGSDTVLAEVRLRPLVEHEQVELKEHVERAVHSAPPSRFDVQKRAMFAIGLLCPIVGILLVRFGRLT